MLKLSRHRLIAFANVLFTFVLRMKALQWYLHEDDLKAGDTGELALIAAQKEEKIHLQNIQA